MDEIERIKKIDDMQEIHKFYELEETICRLDTQYTIYKEKNFFNNITRKTPLKGIILEVGGGSGFQGQVISNLANGLYIHSDYSFPLCYRARKKGLLSAQIDGLSLSVSNESIDIIITIELSTIIHSEFLRNSQFEEFHRALKKNGYLFLVTGILKKGLHCIDKKDITHLQNLGFKKITVSYWGIIPGRFWKSYNSYIFGIIERILSKISIGIRKVVILQKI